MYIFLMILSAYIVQKFLKSYFGFKMDRLEADLRYFRMGLEREQDPFRRRLLMERIAITQQRVLDLLQQERQELERQTANMERARAILRKREED